MSVVGDEAKAGAAASVAMVAASSRKPPVPLSVEAVKHVVGQVYKGSLRKAALHFEQQVGGVVGESATFPNKSCTRASALRCVVSGLSRLIRTLAGRFMQHF